MQTFLPVPDLRRSCELLDDRRLGKQRVETFQILRALTWPRYAWKNHPAVRMWRGFVPALVAYGVVSCDVWTDRGYADTVRRQLLAWTGGDEPDVEALRDAGRLPPWLGVPALHLSHQSALVRKDPEHYRPLFPDAPDDLGYWWPPDVYPRWPARRPAGARGVLPVDAVLEPLGLEAPRDGQDAAVEGVAAGRDVLLCTAPRHGGSTAALLAGLVLPGGALVVDPAPGEPPAAAVPPARPPRASVEDEVLEEAGSPLTEEEGAAQPATTTGSVARPPSDEDRAAMAAEAAEHAGRSSLTFVDTSRLPAAGVGPVDVLVVDRAHVLDSEAAAAVAAERERRGVPLLALTHGLDAAGRAAVVSRLGLRDPLHAGGGFDRPHVWLGVQVLPTERARRTALREALALARPALVAVPDRDRADAVVATLQRAGVRAAATASSMRESRQLQAVRAFRTRRVDALVVPAVELLGLDLGRAPVRALHVAGAVDDRTGWRTLLAAAGPRGERAVSLLLLTADEAGRPGLAPLLAGGCRRAALLDDVGEPVPVPCGGCDVDDPGGAADWLAAVPPGPPAPPSRPDPR